MHKTTESGGEQRRAKNKSSKNRDTKNLEASVGIEGDLLSSVVREDDNAQKGAPADASKLRPRGGAASRVEPTPMSPGGGANQRVASSGDK